MKKTLLVTSLICSGLALGSLSQNAKADETQDQIEAQGNQQIQYYWNQYQQGLQELQRVQGADCRLHIARIFIAYSTKFQHLSLYNSEVKFT